MNTINQSIATTDNTIDNIQINRFNDLSNNVVKNFCCACIDIQKDTWLDKDEKRNRLQNEAKKLNDNLQTLNPQFREYVLNIAPTYKKSSIYVMSHKCVLLRNVVEKLFNFNFSWSTASTDYDKRAKITYTPDKMKEVMNIELAMLLDKYDRVYIFNVRLSFLKCLIEFFDLSTVDFSKLNSLLSDILNQDIEYINLIMTNYGFRSYNSNYKKPRRKKQTGRPTEEEYKALLEAHKDMSRTEFKRLVAAKFGCNEKTIQRDMAKYNLTLR